MLDIWIHRDVPECPLSEFRVRGARWPPVPHRRRPVTPRQRWRHWRLFHPLGLGGLLRSCPGGAPVGEGVAARRLPSLPPLCPTHHDLRLCGATSGDNDVWASAGGGMWSTVGRGGVR